MTTSCMPSMPHGARVGSSRLQSAGWARPFTPPLRSPQVILAHVLRAHIGPSVSGCKGGCYGARCSNEHPPCKAVNVFRSHAACLVFLHLPASGSCNGKKQATACYAGAISEAAFPKCFDGRPLEVSRACLSLSGIVPQPVGTVGKASVSCMHATARVFFERPSVSKLRILSTGTASRLGLPVALPLAVSRAAHHCFFARLTPRRGG